MVIGYRLKGRSELRCWHRNVQSPRNSNKPKQVVHLWKQAPSLLSSSGNVFFVFAYSVGTLEMSLNDSKIFLTHGR